MSDDEKAEHDSDYQKLLALFIALLTNIRTSEGREALYELAKARTDIAIKHALKGFDIDYDYAIQLLKSGTDENLTQRDRDTRDRLVAAVRNLAEFSVCEEYQLYSEAINLLGDKEIDYESDRQLDELESLCRKYNDTYSAIENADISYAMSIAAWWIGIASTDFLVYWTQNDSKVRPWHMELQGYAAPKDEFPSWMIPPIEWNCRCYLTTWDGADASSADARHIRASAKSVSKPSQIDGVFSESVAKCGRIFSASHPYFKVRSADKSMLDDMCKRIKEEYYAG